METTLLIALIGALAAVLAFEGVMALHGEGEIIEIDQFLAVGIFLETGVGYVAGKALVLSFSRGWVPEYMNVPVLFTLILGVYALTNNVLYESGLLAVTVMGFVVGNARLPALRELKRFKEHITVILVSGVFILLAASMEWEMLSQLDLSALTFVLLIIFIARPEAVILAVVRLNGTLKFVGPDHLPKAVKGDRILAFQQAREDG